MTVKNQNDLIVGLSGLVIGLGIAAWAFFTKPAPTLQSAPPPIPITEAKPTEGAVVYTNALGGGSGGAGGLAGGGAPAGAPAGSAPAAGGASGTTRQPPALATGG